MLTKDFGLKLKVLEESGTFVGIASPYGDPLDHYGDVIAAGAYKEAIAQQGKGFPLLFSHRQDEPLGLARIENSAAGLMVHGQLLLDDPTAQRAHIHMKAGSMKGLSIGFLPAAGKTSTREDGARVIHEVRLFEISVVAIPAAPRAQITNVKSLGDVRGLLCGLRDDQIDDSVIADLQSIDHELKRLLLGKQEETNAALVAELRRFSDGLLI